MTAYHTIVVGTDGSDTSLRTVDRAAAVAADSAAELVIVCAYRPEDHEDAAAGDALKGEAFLVRGWTPAGKTLRTAEDRALAAGAGQIRTIAVDGPPVEVLRQAVIDAGADLLVVGNKGLNTISGRLLGSVPSDVALRSSVDVLIVHPICGRS